MTSSFRYWCSTDRVWWDAQVPAAELPRLRRVQRSSTFKPDVWQHPGQPHCPTCGQFATQYLPTEFAAKASRRISTSQIAKSERFPAKQDSVAIQNPEAA